MSTPTQNQGEQFRGNVADATIVTKYVHLIIAQEAISTIEGLPNLPTHQAAAKAQSEKWLSEIWPLIIKTTTDIIDYANTFQAAYNGMIDLIPKLEAGESTAKDDLNKILDDILLTQLRALKISSSSTADKTTAFYDSFQILYQDFYSEFKTIDSKITTDNATLSELTISRASYKSRAGVLERAAIAEGIAVPGVIFAAYVLAVTGGPIGLFAGGIVLVGDLVALGITLGDYAAAMHKVSDLSSQIAALNTELIQLHAVEDQITGLQGNSKSVRDSSKNVAEGWSSLTTSMETLIHDVAQITPAQTASKILKELGPVNMDWGVVLQQAKTLQPTGGQLKVTSLATYDDLLTALDKQAAGA